MSTLGEQLAVLEETVLHLRVEHAQLVGRLAELSDTMAANIEDRDRVIGAKTQVIEDLEAENVKLRADLAHRTSQLHSAVTRIAALKSRMDDLILQNDELCSARDRATLKATAARKRKAALAAKNGGAAGQKQALAHLRLQRPMPCWRDSAHRTRPGAALPSFPTL